MEMAVDNLSGEKHFAHDGLCEPATVSQELKYILEEFGVETKSSICALVTTSGHIVSGAIMGTSINGGAAQAYSASLLDSVLKAVEMLKHEGNTHAIALENDNVKTLFMPVNSGMFLVAIVPPYISARFVEAEIEKYAGRIREILK
jgi:predicted regulator of Ras-like GTPase activity (Roadblock/LC7/MglB family)